MDKNYNNNKVFKKNIKLKIKKINPKIEKKKDKTTLFKIKRRDFEPELFFKIRNTFIDLLKPKNKNELDLYDMYSNIFINIFFLDCRYQAKTENFIKDFLKKYKSKFIKNIKILKY